MKTIEEVQRYLENLTKRVAQGTLYCATHPQGTPQALLVELKYREVWTSRFLSFLNRLNSEEHFGTVAYITSPFGQIVNLLCVMFGTRSGIERDNYILSLATQVATNSDFRDIERFLLLSFSKLENKLTSFGKRSAYTPDELYTSILDFALSGFSMWLEYRRKTTHFN